MFGKALTKAVDEWCYPKALDCVYRGMVVILLVKEQGDIAPQDNSNFSPRRQENHDFIIYIMS